MIVPPNPISSGTGYPWNPMCRTHVAYMRSKFQQRGKIMRGILLWLMGVPVFVIILLYLFNFL